VSAWRIGSSAPMASSSESATSSGGAFRSSNSTLRLGADALERCGASCADPVAGADVRLVTAKVQLVTLVVSFLGHLLQRTVALPEQSRRSQAHLSNTADPGSASASVTSSEHSLSREARCPRRLAWFMSRVLFRPPLSQLAVSGRGQGWTATACRPRRVDGQHEL